MEKDKAEMIKKGDKKRLLGCVASLKEIGGQLGRLSPMERKEVLPLCQQMAMEMGNTIEEKIGEGTELVSLLEKYCEHVYHLYVAAEELEKEVGYETITDVLQRIEEEISAMEAIPTEILFLPYKAAMWDSMESVYKAALKYRDCHVTVMPLPYYNVNPQGDILSVEYEAKQFPEEVIITNFRYYEMREMAPDVIFIHNPYDQYNYVTRLASDYFSTELIKYTKRLVYLPYFVASRKQVPEHYCLVPGVKNAWKTFVQSEEIREAYLPYIRNPERIVALGSPKYDKVKAVEENLGRVPGEWNLAFENKKVFLLNTHLNTIINRAEETVEKLKEIFSFFGQREDLALLWRPHPLSMETARSLNPGFTEKYIDLIEKFKRMSIGIYDESADIHRAIAVSDGYIGNISSIISLYGVTGKPIYIFTGQKNNVYKDGLEKPDDEMENTMRDCSEALRYLYCENNISLEYYIELVKSKKEFCRKERIERFTNLQYGFYLEETAGERIWKYVYEDIVKEELV